MEIDEAGHLGRAFAGLVKPHRPHGKRFLRLLPQSRNSKYLLNF